MTTKVPWRGSMVNSILYLNDRMPRIEIQKENKSQNLLRKQYVSKQSTDPYEYKIAKVLLFLWAEKSIHLSHKRTLWIEEPEYKFRNKACRRTQKGQKSKSTKVQNGMGMRNKWIFLFTICYNHVVSKLKLPEDRGKKWNSYSWPQKSYLDF